MSLLAFLFPSGRGRPSIRVFLGDLTGKLMSIEASLARVEAQNLLFAQVLLGVYQVQKSHTDMLKTIAAAAPQTIDTTALDASISKTDTVIAGLIQAYGISTGTGTASPGQEAQAATPAGADTGNAAAAPAAGADPTSGAVADPASGAAAEPGPTSAPQPDAPAAGAATTA